MQRLIARWIAVCILFTVIASCSIESAPHAVTPPTSAPPAVAAKPLTGSNSAELPNSETSTPGAGEALPTAPPTAPPPSIALEHLSDAQIVGITQASNSAEVAQARIARMRATRSEVKQFAAMMISHDDEVELQQAKLGIPVADSPVGDQLRSEGSSMLQKLRGAISDDFDRVYIDAQVDEQRKMLTLMETQLLPDAKDSKLKVYLAKTKLEIQTQLQRAEMQQQALSSNATPGFVEAAGNPPPLRNPGSR